MFESHPKSSFKTPHLYILSAMWYIPTKYIRGDRPKLLNAHRVLCSLEETKLAFHSIATSVRLLPQRSMDVTFSMEKTYLKMYATLLMPSIFIIYIQGRPSGLKTGSAERGGEFQGMWESRVDFSPECAPDFWGGAEKLPVPWHWPDGRPCYIVAHGT